MFSKDKKHTQVVKQLERAVMDAEMAYTNRDLEGGEFLRIILSGTAHRAKEALVAFHQIQDDLAHAKTENEAMKYNA